MRRPALIIRYSIAEGLYRHRSRWSLGAPRVSIRLTCVASQTPCPVAVGMPRRFNSAAMACGLVTGHGSQHVEQVTCGGGQAGRAASLQLPGRWW
jgi:hypothetical protein